MSILSLRTGISYIWNWIKKQRRMSKTCEKGLKSVNRTKEKEMGVDLYGISCYNSTC